MKIPIVVTGGSFYPPLTVTAELLFELAPHLADVGTFAVHRNAYYPDLGWQITHIETGYRIGPEMDTKSEAMKQARKLLSAKTAKDIERAIRKTGIKE